MDVLNALVLVVTYCKKTGERTCARSPASAPKLVASKRSLFSDAVLALAQPLDARAGVVRLLPSSILLRTSALHTAHPSSAGAGCCRPPGVLPALPPLARGSLRARAAAHNSASDGGGGTFDSHGRPAAEPAAPPPSTSVPTLSDISGERFRRRERLSGSPSFQRVQRFGRSFLLQHMRLQVASNVDVEDATCTRIGIITTKKSLRRAVDRNLMRRRVKNIFRKHKALFPSRVDLVVLVNTSALEAKYAELEADLLAWAAQVQGNDALFQPKRTRRSVAEAPSVLAAAIDETGRGRSKPLQSHRGGRGGDAGRSGSGPAASKAPRSSQA